MSSFRDFATRDTTTAVVATRAANVPSSTSRLPVLVSEVENSSESRTIAAKSATEAAATVLWPSRVSSLPASLSTGTTNP